MFCFGCFPLSLVLTHSLFELALFNLEFRYIYWDLRHLNIYTHTYIYIYIYIYIKYWLLLWIVFIKFVVLWYCNFYRCNQMNCFRKKKKKKKNKQTNKQTNWTAVSKKLEFFDSLFYLWEDFLFWLEKVKLTLIGEPMDRIWTRLLWKSKDTRARMSPFTYGKNEHCLKCIRWNWSMAAKRGVMICF